MKRMAVYLIITLFTLAGSTLVATKPVMGSTPSGWAEADVRDMIQQGLVPRELQGAYQSHISRGEYTLLLKSVLHHLVGGKEEELHRVLTEHRFVDSYEQHVYEAYQFGIVNGVTTTTFEPDRPILRSEAVVMMANILTTLRVEGLDDKQAPYVDYAAIPGWARKSADITYNASIFLGSDAGMEPDKPYTREQAIVTMKRLLTFVGEVKGISYRGKIFIAFDQIDDVRVGQNYVKIGSPKSQSLFDRYWASIAHNFEGISVTGTSSEKVTSGEFTIETLGTDYLIRVSW